MKYCLTLLLFLSVGTFAQAQNKKQISLDLNRSFHGTGDLRGLGFAVEYGHYFSKRFEITGGVATNVHHDVYPLLLNQSGQIIDASYRMVTGGLQLNGQANIAPLHTSRHEVKLGIGPVVRYQSSSASGGYDVISATNYPEPVFTFRQYEKQNMVTLGYLTTVSYSFTFPGQILIGAKASFQNDTNADVITQYGLRIGKRF